MASHLTQAPFDTRGIEAGPPCDYRAYGLWVRSPVTLPFTPLPTPSAGEPDVTVRIGAVPEALPAPAERRPVWEAAPGAFLRRVSGVARFLVTGGRDVLSDGPS